MTAKKKTTAVAVVKKTAKTVIKPSKQKDGVEGLISQAIGSGASVETMERLFTLREKMKAEMAQEAFIVSMAAFQAECPTIKKTKVVLTKNGGEAYRYAPIDSIVSQVKDTLKKHGFSYSSNMEFADNMVKVYVKVQHILGHREVTEMMVPLGGKTAVMSDSQVVAAASTFAKRYAFLNAFGILTGDDDDDARSVDETITPPQVNVFERAKQMIGRATDPAVLDDYWKKVSGSDKYTPEQKESVEGLIAARVAELEKAGAEATIA